MNIFHLYLLLINALAFVLGFTAVFVSMGALAGTVGSFLIKYWVPVSLALQSVMSFVIIRSAIYCLNPVKNEKK